MTTDSRFFTFKNLRSCYGSVKNFKSYYDRGIFVIIGAAPFTSRP